MLLSVSKGNLAICEYTGNIAYPQRIGIGASDGSPREWSRALELNHHARSSCASAG
jgi:hypothetical protein